MNRSENSPNIIGRILRSLLWIVCWLAFFSFLCLLLLAKTRPPKYWSFSVVWIFIQPIYFFMFLIGNIVFSFISFKVKDVWLMLRNALSDENIEISTYKKYISIVKTFQKANIYLGIIIAFISLIGINNHEVYSKSFQIRPVILRSLVALIYIGWINLCIFFPIELKLKAKNLGGK